jgi:hypothetical protein
MTDRQAPANSVDLDGLSLEQTLIDFQVANGRVIDLTSRLLASERERMEAVSEREHLRNRCAALEAELDQIKLSKPYRGLRLLSRMRAEVLKR